MKKVIKKIVRGTFLEQPAKDIYRIILRCIPLRLQYGKSFIETYCFLNASQSWDRERLKEYQLLKTKEILSFCNRHVPFYQKRWGDYGININKIHDFSDFAKLPFTTKEDAINSHELMVPTLYNKNKLILTNTGGTTGSKAFFYITKNANQKEKAFFARYWKWHSYNFAKDECIVFRGSIQKSPNIIEQSGYEHLFSSFDVTNERLRTYINYIAKKKICYIQAYPSFAYQMYKFAYENGLSGKLAGIHCVLCGSEKLYGYQKKFIEDKFNIKLYDHYGHVEYGALFQQCAYNDSYHVISEYGYTEFEPVKDTNGLFEIISTGFNNLATPLIRYKTKDYVKLQKDVDCACGLKYPKIVKEIEGRSGDVVITPNGKIIGPSHLEYAERGTQSFNDWQIIQDGLDHLVLLIVPSERFVENDEVHFKERLLWRLDEKMHIDIKIVNEIKRPVSQKKRLIISKLKT